MKRTYNLSAAGVHRVRELAELDGLPDTQDGVVEMAIERLYLEVRGREEAAAWETAAADPSFRTDMGAVARDFRDGEAWPA